MTMLSGNSQNYVRIKESQYQADIAAVDALRVPLKTIQERIGHALTEEFPPLDVYGHTLDWKANDDAAKGLGEELAKAVTKAESNLNSGPLTAHPKENFRTRDSEV